MAKLNVLITGANGQLGKSFTQINGVADVNYIFATKNELNICDQAAVASFLQKDNIDVLVNCAAYTNVNNALDDKDLAMAINGVAPGMLASICKQMDIRFFHISTDYVFDGDKKQPYTELDECRPINTYGFSKLAGEQAITEVNQDAVIIRTSWVFSEFGNNFVKTILDLAKKQPTLKLINDQVGGPTWAKHIAELVDKILYFPANLVDGGIYHFSGYPWLSWHDFAREILFNAQEQGKLDKLPELIAINSNEWPSKEPRPLNSRLDSSKLVGLFHAANDELRAANQPRLFKSINVPFQRDWRQGLNSILV